MKTTLESAAAAAAPIHPTHSLSLSLSLKAGTECHLASKSFEYQLSECFHQRLAVALILLRGTYVISGTLAHIALVPSLPADSQVTPFSSCAHLLCDCDYSCPCHNHDP